MTTGRENQNLTQSARALLDNLLSERRTEILRYAARNSGAEVPLDQVDVLRAYLATEGSLSRDLSTEPSLRPMRVARDAMLPTVLAVTSALMALAVAGLLIAGYVLGVFDTPAGTGASPGESVIGVLAGLAVPLVAAVIVFTILLSRRRGRHRHEAGVNWRMANDLAGMKPLHFEEGEADLVEPERMSAVSVAFIQAWGDVEAELRGLAKVALGNHYDPRSSLRPIIDSLVHDKVLSEDTEFRIKRVLIARNEVMHRPQARADWAALERDLKLISEEIAGAARVEKSRTRHGTE